MFKSNVKYIDSVNKKNLGYRLGLNKFADLSDEEFRAMYLKPMNMQGMEKLKRRGLKNVSFTSQNLNSLPTSFDWRGAVEGLHAIETGDLISLSEQQSLDCNPFGYNCDSGGRGGDIFQYIIDIGGLISEDRYPYQGFQGPCRFAEIGNPAAAINDFEVLQANDEAILKARVTQQPVPITLPIGQSLLDFQLYTMGIFEGTCGEEINHGAVLVGYGKRRMGQNKGKKFWRLKNFWGKDWGEEGYMRLLRDIEAPEGMCNITSFPMIPMTN
eukprot:PITA_33943